VKTPRTPAQWQQAVNGAEFFLLVESARQYGLIEGGPGVNADRCAEILRRGAARGIRPLPFDELAKLYLPALMSQDAAPL